MADKVAEKCRNANWIAELVYHDEKQQFFTIKKLETHFETFLPYDVKNEKCKSCLWDLNFNPKTDFNFYLKENGKLECINEKNINYSEIHL